MSCSFLCARSPVIFTLLTCLLVTNLLDAKSVTIAKDGKALLPIQVDSNASEVTVATAGILRNYLNQISRSEFPIVRGRQGKGIYLKVDERRDLALLEREDYSIVTNAKGVVLAGNSDMALEHAVWDLLYRLGHRQFFPGETWEVIPRTDGIVLDLNLKVSPDYKFRRIWYGFGTWGYNKQPWEDWCHKNRLGGSLRVQSGHSYGGIISANKKQFDAHPEFYALIDGKRAVKSQGKFCISNASLRQLVVEHAKRHFLRNPQADCISMDPSDGGGWCECEHCGKIGSQSDQALLLANQVADTVKPKFVGMYAYSYHSPPPSLTVRPNVCINAATAFIKGGLTIDEIVSGWSKKGAKIGIREYYSVNTWDRDMPGAARGSNLDYLSQTLPHFHRQGARFLNSESSDNWGCNGLGYYFAARTMFDLDEVKRRDSIVEDFLQKAFGPAVKPMREFYNLIEGSNKSSKLVYEDLLGRMYRSLAAARQLTKSDSKERRRIDELVLYTEYVRLFDEYRTAKGELRQTKFEAMIRHTYRMRETMLVHARAIYRDVVARDKSVSIPSDALWGVPENRNPWKSSEEFTGVHIDQMVASGIQTHTLVQLDFEPLEFSADLVPPSTAHLENALRASKGATSVRGQANRARGKRSWYTWTDEKKSIELTVTGGLIAHYRNRGNVKIKLLQIGGASETGEKETFVSEDSSVPPDGVARNVTLVLPKRGLYRIDIDDGNDLTEIEWAKSVPMTWRATLAGPHQSVSGRWTLWFYVPHNTKRVGMYVNTRGGKVLNPAGDSMLDLSDRTGGFVSVKVPEDQQGTYWRLSQVAGTVCLMNVPPCLARSPGELLLPRAVLNEK